MNFSKFTIAIVIPAYRMERNIQEVLRGIPAQEGRASHKRKSASRFHPTTKYRPVAVFSKALI